MPLAGAEIRTLSSQSILQDLSDNYRVDKRLGRQSAGLTSTIIVGGGSDEIESGRQSSRSVYTSAIADPMANSGQTAVTADPSGGVFVRSYQGRRTNRQRCEVREIMPVQMKWRRKRLYLIVGYVAKKTGLW
jgi:hypothetical protein